MLDRPRQSRDRPGIHLGDTGKTPDRWRTGVPRGQRRSGDSAAGRRVPRRAPKGPLGKPDNSRAPSDAHADASIAKPPNDAAHLPRRLRELKVRNRYLPPRSGAAPGSAAISGPLSCFGERPTCAEAQRSYGGRPVAKIATSHHTGPTDAMVAGPRTHAGNPASPAKTACQATVCPNSQRVSLTRVSKEGRPK